MAHRDDSNEAGKPWFALAIGSLLVAGAFALLLVIGRVPPFSGWLGDSAGFFKRCLVVHVDLSIVVWFHAFTAGLFAKLPGGTPGSHLRTLGVASALVGVAALFSCIFLESAEPILSNYVPSLDHPLFLAGIGAFFVGVALTFLDGRLWPSADAAQQVSVVPPEAQPGLRAAAVAFLFAVLTFGASVITTPDGLLPATRNEFVFWGGGHVLQVCSVAAMVTVWLMLLTPALGQAPVPRRWTVPLFAVLVLPTALAPALAMAGTTKVWVHDGFTLLMRFGIFPVVSGFAFFCVRAVVRARRGGVVPLNDPRLLAFFASLGLTTVGFVIGAFINGSNTIVPAHYHASIGAVTVSFMAITYPLLLNGAHRFPRLAALSRWQPVLFGGGQMVFAIGFALAGSQGMARKAYAAEQHVRTATELAGLVVMGLGGLVAVGGGLLFLLLVLTSFARGPRKVSPWQPSLTPSKP
jgi:hypothetical protein